MVTACRFYGDDSGSHGKGTFVIAGYLATDENWADLSHAWQRELAVDPMCPYFHMGSNYHGDEPFDGWPGTAREQKRSRMLATMEPFGRVIVELSSVISWNDYNCLDPRFRSVFPDPYYFCFYGIVSLVKEWLSAQNERPNHIYVSYTFDRQSALEAHVRQHFVNIRNQFPQLECYLRELCFEDDRCLPGLQIADSIAWLIRRDLVKPAQDCGVTRPELKYLRGIYQNDTKIRIWRSDGLAEFWSRNGMS